MVGERITAKDFDYSKVPNHLRVTFCVVDDSGRDVAVGKDLDALRRTLGGKLRVAIARTTTGIERSGLNSWDFEALDEMLETNRDGHLVRGYPALVDDGTSVSIRVFSKPTIQAKIMRAGVRRMLLLTVPVPRKAVGRDLSNAALLAIGQHPTIKLSALVDDCVIAAADAVLDTGPLPWTRANFAVFVEQARHDLAPSTTRLLGIAGAIILAAAAVQAKLDRLVTPLLAPSVADCRAQLAQLVCPGFVAGAGVLQLPELLRYVQAIDRRLEKLPQDPLKDQQRMREILTLERRYRDLLARLQPSEINAQVVSVAWMLEELRVSTFAQVLGVAQPVSTQRISRALDRLTG